MKKDKKWLKNEIEIMGSETSESYPHSQVVDRGDVLDLVDQLDEPEKVVIPQFVADWWERDADSVTMYGRLRVEKKHKFDLISIFYDKGLGDYLSKVEDWIYENDSAFLDLVNGKPYEIEKEKLYYVVSPDNLTMLYKDNGVEVKSSHGYLLSQVTQHGFEHKSFYQLTEKEIKNYDERFWPFAVEVVE